MDVGKCQDLRDIFSRAEQRIKVIESRVDRGLIVPLVNELRYAGYHTIRYLTDGNEAELEKAIGHSKRSLYDAYEMELSLYIVEFSAFCDRWEAETRIVIDEVVPAYPEWNDLHELARSTMESKRQMDGREDYYADLEPHIEVLRAINIRLPRANLALTKKKKIADRNHSITYISSLLSLIAVLIATLFWLFPDVGRRIGEHAFGLAS